VTTSEANSAEVMASLPQPTNLTGAALLTASKLTRLGLRLVFLLAAGRVLGPRLFGIYVLVLAVSQMTAVAAGSGFVDYLTRETAKDERLGWRAGIQLMLLQAGYAIPLGLAAFGLLRLLGYREAVLAAAALMLLTMIPRAASECVQGVLRGLRRYGSFLALDLSAGLVLLGGGCWMLARGGSLRFVVATELAAAVSAGLLGLGLIAAIGRPQRGRLRWRALMRKTLVFNIYPLTISLYDRVDILLLSKLAGDYATGIYGMAYRALSTLQLIPYGVLYSLLPSVARDHWGSSERESLEGAMGLLLNVAFAAILATIAFAGPAVNLLLGPGYAESVPAVEILIWALIPMYLNFAFNTGLLATGNEKVFISTSSFCLGINFAANLLLIPLFSWRAAAALTIVTELALLAQNTYWIRRAIGVVPIPFNAVRTTLIFLGLLAALLVGSQFASPLLVGGGCLLLFLAYFYREGASAQYVAGLRAERARAS
jgi:O-antigen/teichoic acid export membrane protein